MQYDHNAPQGLQRIMELRRLTCGQIAMWMQVDRRTVGFWRQGRRGIPVGQAKRLAERLGVSLDELLRRPQSV